MNSSSIKSGVILLSFAVALPLHAGEQAGEQGGFSAAVGGTSFKSEYKGYKDTSGAFVFGQYQGDGWSVGLGGLNYRLLGTDDSPLSISATLTSVNGGFDSGDSDFFKGMSDRDRSIDLGLSAEYQLGAGQLNASILGDVSSTHKGFVMDLSYSQGFELGSVFFEPQVGMEFLSSNYTDYYYGVRSSEATASRAAYNADSAVNPYVGYNVVYPINKSVQLIHNANYTWLSSEIKDSSLVDRNSRWSTSVGINYRF